MPTKPRDIRRMRDFWLFMNALADGQSARPVFYDETISKVLADFLEEHGDARAVIARHANRPHLYGLDGNAAPHPGLPAYHTQQMVHPVIKPGQEYKTYPEQVESFVDNVHTHVRLAAQFHLTPLDTPPVHRAPILQWTQHIPRTVSSTGTTRTARLTASVTPEQLHQFIDMMPKGKTQNLWRAAAERNGWHKEEPKLTETPERLARAKRPALPHPEAAALLEPIIRTLEAQRAWHNLSAAQRRATPYPRMDHTNRLVLADWMQERNDPREALLRGHVDPGKAFEHPDRPGEESNTLEHYTHVAPFGFEGDTLHPGIAHTAADVKRIQTWGPQTEGITRHPVIVWRSPIKIRERLAEGFGTAHGIQRSYTRTPVMFVTPVSRKQLFSFIDGLPKAHQDRWHRYAAEQGWTRPEKPEAAPERLARNEGKTLGAGGAQGQLRSENHTKRMQLLRYVLREANLTPNTVRSALASDRGGLRPSAIAVLRTAHSPEHARFAAAWYGLLSGEPRLTVFHPGEGEDMLHLIDSPHSADRVGDYLRRANLGTFAVESRGSGSRAYLTSNTPPPPPLLSALNASHSTLRGIATRLGADPGSPSASDARADYRTTIREFERSVGANAAA